MPDRLPSLVVLVGFWVPPMVAGWVAAHSYHKSTKPNRDKVTLAVLATFVVSYAAAWFFLNLQAMPPYIPGATRDPTYAPPKAVASLALLTAALILPGSAIASALAFWRSPFSRATP